MGTVRPRRNAITRLMSSSTRRAPVPSGAVGIARVPRVADRSSGSGSSVSLFGQLHFIEGWDIADDSVDEFTTTHRPLSGSWNLMLNGLRVHRDEFTISNKTITIADPADLFLGADVQGSPWDLEIQYDYIQGLTPHVFFVGSDQHGQGAGSGSIAVPGDIAEGDLILLFGTGGLTTPTGFTHEDSEATGGFLNVYLFSKIADGTETTVSLVTPGNGAVAILVLRNAALISVDGSAQNSGGGTYAEPTAAVLEDDYVVYWTAAKGGGSVSSLGTDVDILEGSFGDTGSIRAAMGSFTATADGTSPAQTAVNSGAPDEWASIIAVVRAV